MTQIPILETARLRIRPPERDDLENIHQMIIDAGWVDGDLDAAREARREWLEWAVRNHTALAKLHQPPYGDRTIILHSGEFVGMVGLVPVLAPFGKLPYFRAKLPPDANPDLDFPEVGLFWAALKSQRGQGYVTEAAQALIQHMFGRNLHRIIAQTEYDNIASIAVMERLGMTIERNPHDAPPWLQVVGILEKQISINKMTNLRTTTRD